MNAMAIEGSSAENEAGLHQPLCIPSGEHQLHGWLHRPAGVHAPTWGVVVCKPFGFEALCAHRSIRAFADAAAARGLPVLRFDYLGTGDSADIDPNAEQIAAWTRDITHAVAELRRRTGVTRVCLLGFRLGVLLATLAAAQCEVHALALVAPVLSGRRYLREARTAQLAAEAAEAAAGGTVREAAAALEGGMEVSGYPLSAATVATLSATDAAAANIPSSAPVLLIDRSDLPLAQAWSQALGARGIETDYRVLPGFVEMMMTDPQFAAVPEKMLAATSDWLAALVKRPAGTAAPMATPDDTRPVAIPDEMLLPGGRGSPESTLTERPVFFAEQPRLFGIVTEPRRDEVRRRAVILLNSGATYHIGASRTNVSLARRWAERGYYVLRMDLSGLGESRPRGGRAENEIFPPQALDDIRAAIDFMSRSYGAREITLGGLCSGAYHALRAAVAGLPLHRLLMVNPQNYFWDESMSIEGLQLAEVVRNPGIYRERMFSGSAWRRFLTGQVNVWRIARIYLNRPLLALQSKLRDAARAVGIHLRHDLGRELETVIASGIRVVFVFARGEPGLDLLKIEAGSMIRRLGERCRVRIIDSADHTFSRSGPRKVLEDVLSEELFARQELSPVADIAERKRLRSA